ncbi:transposase [Oceanobacillus arenosus]|uniref:Transposase n=1 Tax=Oceanobacillus arenosus TaxID=1229153 RepID=A0A3D8PKU5_9BACI|nr:Rpn family recombination-promoting nuclease/putative transposase [Oceanobacillus arenosus]RDW15805.1 transposase [Oceanobacillus arenosus]
MKIQSPHDKMFKETFGNVEVAQSFLAHYLPHNLLKIIDVTTFELLKDSFINKELAEDFSDLLFHVNIEEKDGFIYFLFEHKSYSSKDISFQLLRYMISIWDAKIKKEQITELPVILPLVIYHGKEDWNSTLTLGEMILGYQRLPKEIQKFIPDYEYLLYDLSTYTDEEIKGMAQLRIVLTLFRDIMTKDGEDLIMSIERAISYLYEIDDLQTGMDYFQTMMRYIFGAKTNFTSEEVKTIMERIEKDYPEGSEVIMSIADLLREEGRGEGREEGREEEKVELIMKAINEGLNLELIAKITGLSIKEVEKIANERKD